jgi:hypothetical protein
LSPEILPMLQIIIIPKRGDLRCILGEQKLQIQKVLTPLLASPEKRV